MDDNIQSIKQYLINHFRHRVQVNLADLDDSVQITQALCPEQMQPFVANWWTQSRETLLDLNAAITPIQNVFLRKHTSSAKETAHDTADDFFLHSRVVWQTSVCVQALLPHVDGLIVFQVLPCNVLEQVRLRMCQQVWPIGIANILCVFPPGLSVASRPSRGAGARLSVIGHQYGDDILGLVDNGDVLQEAIARIAEGIADHEDHNLPASHPASASGLAAFA